MTVAQKCQGAMEIQKYHFAKIHLSGVEREVEWSRCEVVWSGWEVVWSGVEFHFSLRATRDWKSESVMDGRINGLTNLQG